MWFWLALATVIIWGCADLFYKKGSDEENKYSHLEIASFVGVAMGIAATVLVITGESITFREIVSYLPVSFFYIVSMVVGYAGLRYLALSIASPVQNSSGAFAAILLFVITRELPALWEILGTVFVTVGIVYLAYLENKSERGDIKNKYTKGAAALLFPIFYCILDAAGTFLDGLYLDEWELIGEEAANIAYFYTFFAFGLVCIIYLAIKKHKPQKKNFVSMGLAAALETGGQFTYVYAMSANASASAPLVASYCAVSVLLSAVVLKERLKAKQYIALLIVFAGIVFFGISEMLAEAQG